MPWKNKCVHDQGEVVVMKSWTNRRQYWTSSIIHSHSMYHDSTLCILVCVKFHDHFLSLEYDKLVITAGHELEPVLWVISIERQLHALLQWLFVCLCMESCRTHHNHLHRVVRLPSSLYRFLWSLLSTFKVIQNSTMLSCASHNHCTTLSPAISKHWLANLVDGAIFLK